MSDQIYCFVGFESDEASHTVDLRNAADDPGAMAEAKRFLSDHRSCLYVEVWRRGFLLGVVPPRTD